MTEYNEKLTFYRAVAGNKGGAICLELKRDNSCGFISAAKQTETIESESGQKFGKYDWENKLNIKIELTDIGELLSVFSNRVEEAKLYHKFGDQTKMVNVKRSGATYDIRVSESKENAVSMRLSMAEAALMYTALNQLAIKLLKWD